MVWRRQPTPPVGEVIHGSMHTQLRGFVTGFDAILLEIHDLALLLDDLNVALHVASFSVGGLIPRQLSIGAAR